MYKMMTPGPTQVRENVMLARSCQFPNPDLDEEFVGFYKDTCLLISELLHTKNETLILNGEGILGLEAACASITENGDRVLVLDNGIYGKGFQDFVTMYGGEAVLYSKDYRKPLDVLELVDYLDSDHDFKYATIVHCDTPSGMLNDIGRICPLLKSYGIMTVVDSVSGMFGEAVKVDEWKIDLLCGGSQKAVSAPPGLSFVTLSEDAWKIMHKRKRPIASFYANLLVFEKYFEEKWFPYTMPVSDIYGLRQALENIKEDEGMLARHEKIAKFVRDSLLEMGLKLYSESGFSNTVTVFVVPDGWTDRVILSRMKEEYGILLAGSFGEFSERVIRIGHMGENANEEDVRDVIAGLRGILEGDAGK
jgi:aspartate aminotransferase-like enzyme